MYKPVKMHSEQPVGYLTDHVIWEICRDSGFLSFYLHNPAFPINLHHVIPITSIDA